MRRHDLAKLSSIQVEEQGTEDGLLWNACGLLWNACGLLWNAKVNRRCCRHVTFECDLLSSAGDEGRQPAKDCVDEAEFQL